MERLLHYTEEAALMNLQRKLLSRIRNMEFAEPFRGYEEEFALIRAIYLDEPESSIAERFDYETIDSLMGLFLSYPVFETWMEGFCSDCYEDCDGADENQAEEECACAVSHPLHKLILSAYLQLKISREMNQIKDQSDDDLI